MATRVATLDYRTTGVSGATSNVRTLTQAVDAQKRSVQGLAPAMAAAQRGTGFLGAVSQSAAGQTMMLTSSLGPLGAGLGVIALRAPQAATGLLATVAAQERLGLLSRASNAALLGGAAVMATGAVAAVAYAGSILRGADAYASLHSRIKIFSDGTVDAAQNEAELYRRAADARAAVQGLSTLYVRITPAIQDMGRAQSDALAITELSSKALAIQGATASEALASTIQFSQAIASGVLRGDELRSMLESSPLLLRYIAQNLELNGKIGVAFGQMRKLGEEGALTADRLISALLRAGPAIEEDFVNAPKTAQQGWTILMDTVTRAVGQMAQATGLQQGVFDFLGGLATRLDAFREQVLLDPDALEPAVRAGELLGDTLETAGDLAGGVVEHFDLIVGAAQALIALKAGEVLAVGFGAAAAKAREAYAAVQSFRANGVFIAGAALDQTGAAAAINARAAATAAEARAVDLKMQAEVRARTATAARAAADAASAAATQLKTTAEAEATAVAAAETRASALNTAAERAETAAKTATTAATNAQTAASTRLAIAQEAELAVTSQVTNAQALKAAVGRGLNTLYMAMGGSLGVLTLALGGLIYAVWQAQSAWDDKVRSLRDAVVVSDELISISNALASATWAEVPALLAAADAHRQKAAAALEDARATLSAAQARADAADASVGQGSPYPGTGSAAFPGAGVQARQMRAVVAAAERDVFAATEASRKINLEALVVEGRSRGEEVRTGRDSAGRPLSAERRQENEARLAQINSLGLRNYEAVERLAVEQRAAITAATDPAERQRLQRGLTVYNRSMEAAGEAATVGQIPARVPTTPNGGSGGRTRRSSEDRATATLLERVADAGLIDQLMGRTTPASTRFSVRDGTLFDGDTAFKARSEDEARAASAYLEQIEAITGAKQALVAETGMTREALAAQAAQTLATALSTSQATQAEQRWAERMAEARGESTAVASAEREVAEARRTGVEITKDAEDAYIRLIAAQERKRRSDEALQAARPVVDAVVRETLEDMGRMPQDWDPAAGDMGLDFEAAMRQWADARVRIQAEAEARVREITDREVAAGTLSATAAAERVAAVRVAVEAANAEQIAEIWKRQREDDEQAWQARFDERLQQERDLADSITGSLEDLAMGGDPSDLGRRFGEDLLRGIWSELVTNPLNLAIRTVLRGMMSGDGTQGLWGQLLGAVGIQVGTGIVSQAPVGAGPGAGVFADGGLPGLTRPGLIRGPGGPRDDRILARVSNREYIVNAEATRRHFGLLQALNNGLPAFADGGLPGGSLADLLTRETESGDFGYAYRTTPMDHDRDRRQAEQSVTANVDMPITIVNQTSEPVQARATRTPSGGLEVILEPLVQAQIQKSGADGSLAKALGRSPKPRRR